MISFILESSKNDRLGMLHCSHRRQYALRRRDDEREVRRRWVSTNF